MEQSSRAVKVFNGALRSRSIAVFSGAWRRSGNIKHKSDSSRAPTSSLDAVLEFYSSVSSTHGYRLYVSGVCLAPSREHDIPGTP